MKGARGQACNMRHGRRGQVIKLRNQGWAQDGGESQAYPHDLIYKVTETPDGRKPDVFFSSSLLTSARRLERKVNGQDANSSPKGREESLMWLKPLTHLGSVSSLSAPKERS